MCHFLSIFLFHLALALAVIDEAEDTILAAIDLAREEVNEVNIVGGHHHRRAFLAGCLQERDDARCRLGVEVARRLIGNDDLRFVEQGAGDGDTLLLATREFARHLLGLVAHADLCKHLDDAAVYLLIVGPSRGLQDKTEVAIDGAVVEQLEVLKDDAHLLAKGGDAASAQSQHALAKDVGTFGVLGIDVKLAVDGLQ